MLVGTDFGPGAMTESGYPRIVKVAPRAATGRCRDDLRRRGIRRQRRSRLRQHTRLFERLLASQSTDFFNRERYEAKVRGDELVRIDVPTDAAISIHRTGC